MYNLHAFLKVLFIQTVW